MNQRVMSALQKPAIAAFVVAALALAGCGGTGSSTGNAPGTQGSGSVVPERGGSLSIATTVEPTTLDPSTAIGGAEINTIGQILEPLFRTNAENEVEPWLVTKYAHSDDKRVWTLHLRQGVNFSDGKPMTAQDVVFSIENAKKSPVWGSTLDPISKVRAASPSTVVIEGKDPVPAMPALLSLFAAGIIPKNFGGVSEKEFAQHPVGTGPFTLGKWIRGQSLTLDANPNYWDKGLPYLDSIVFEVAPNPNAALSRFKGGELDAVGEPPWSQLSAIEDAPETNVVKVDDGLTDFLVLNAKNKLFQDPRAREAVNLAIDREAVVKTALNGYGKPAGPLTPYSLLYTDPNLKGATQDVPKATKLLAEAVKATGEQPKLTLDTIAGDSYGEIASQILQQDLNEAGFEIQIQPLDSAANEEEFGTGHFDIDLLKIYSTMPDPIEFWPFYVATNAVFSGAPVAEVDKLQKEAASETDPEKRKDLYYRIQEIIAKENYLVVFDDRPWTWGVASDVVGFSVNASGSTLLAEAGFAK